MPGNKRSIKSDLAKVDRRRIKPREYDDAPELDDDFFERAEIRDGETVIRRGRPPLGRVSSASATRPASNR